MDRKSIIGGVFAGVLAVAGAVFSQAFPDLDEKLARVIFFCSCAVGIVAIALFFPAHLASLAASIRHSEFVTNLVGTRADWLPPKPVVLTEDERRLRDGLKTFAHHAQLSVHRAGDVWRMLCATEKEINDGEPGSIALHAAFYFWDNNVHLNKMVAAASPPLEDLNVQRVSEAIKAFLVEYEQRQKMIGNLAAAAGIDAEELEERPEFRKWLIADTFARVEFEKIAQSAGLLNEDQFASGQQRHWAKLWRVNY